jgi:hypothetical protein
MPDGHETTVATRHLAPMADIIRDNVGNNNYNDNFNEPDTIPLPEPLHPERSQNFTTLSPTNPNEVSTEKAAPCCSRRSRSPPKYLNNYI